MVWLRNKKISFSVRTLNLRADIEVIMTNLVKFRVGKLRICLIFPELHITQELNVIIIRFYQCLMLY